jgi:phage repressor protein C with HTH and peptisase S24 domain
MSITKVSEEKLKKLGEYIKKIREEKELGTNQLATKIGLSPSYITRLEKGHIATVHPYLLKSVADGLRIDYKELYKIVAYLDRETPIKSNIDTDLNYKSIPFYKSISAGLGMEGLEDEEVEFISVPDTKQFSGDVVAIKVSGDSMEYTIESGAIVFVKKDVEVSNKKVGAFIYNNMALLKRLVVLEDKTYLRSDNREYPDIEIIKGDDFQTVGRVIGQIEAVE